VAAFQLSLFEIGERRIVHGNLRCGRGDGVAL
jgi:hypothetical protein